MSSSLNYIDIPGKGKLQTQIYETRMRIHCYFDEDEKNWLRLPIAWELYSRPSQELISLIKSVCPQWQNDADILAALRVSNYSIDNCINIYQLTIGKYPKSLHPNYFFEGSEAKTIADKLSEELKIVQHKFEQIDKSLKISDSNLKDLQSKNEELLECNAKLKLEAKRSEEELKQKISEWNNKSLEQVKQKGAVNVDSLKFVLNTFTNFAKLSENLKNQNKESIGTHQKQLNELKEKITKLVEIVGVQDKELKSVRALYRQEAQARKALYNNLIELNGNIRVFCRVRPPTKEIKDAAWFTSDSNDHYLNLTNAKEGARKKYEFDRVFTDKSTQEQVFSALSDIIASSIDGYNVCIMAYGQTGSGKTHTMEGSTANPGVNTRAIRELLRLIKTREKIVYTLELVIVEIYNEQIVDLLKPNPEVVELRQSGLTNVTSKIVTNEEELKAVITSGNKNRKMASTKMNSTSSRSHLIVCVNLIGNDSVSGNIIRGRLVLCDLAGSERVKKSGTTSGERFQEATAINLSLSALGQVFSALKLNQLHVPYRNSKLTQLLQPCLGGDSKTVLIVTVSGETENQIESMSTIQFGSEARQVTLGQAKANVTSSSSGPSKKK